MHHLGRSHGTRGTLRYRASLHVVLMGFMAAALTSHITSAAAAQDLTIPSSANAFNPAISLILSGTYTHLSQEPATYALLGFALGDAASPGQRGFGISPTELHLGVNIDPDLYGAMALILNPDDTVALEEIYFQTTGLDHGVTVKGGQFFSGIGALNQKHPHAWDFIVAASQATSRQSCRIDSAATVACGRRTLSGSGHLMAIPGSGMP